MNLWTRAARLRSLGILGMNRRNSECILDLNPRSRFPQVDDKKRMRDLCRSIGVATPDLYAVVAAHSALRRLQGVLERRKDFVIKPSRGAGGRGVLVVVGRDGSAFMRHNGERLEMGDVSQHVSSIISGLFSFSRPMRRSSSRVIGDPAFEQISYQGRRHSRDRLPLRADYGHASATARLSGGRANLHQRHRRRSEPESANRTSGAAKPSDRAPPRHRRGVIGFAPGWRQILDMACASASDCFGYVGVDIVIDRNRGLLWKQRWARSSYSDRKREVYCAGCGS